MVNDINGMGHIDTLLRTCAVKGCDLIGLQKPKQDRISEIMAYGSRVHFSGGCSGVEGREEQQRVGIAIKEKIVKNAGKDGIAIEYICARRLLKARPSIKPNCVTFVVAYATTEEASDG